MVEFATAMVVETVVMLATKDTTGAGRKFLLLRPGGQQLARRVDDEASECTICLTVSLDNRQSTCR